MVLKLLVSCYGYKVGKCEIQEQTTDETIESSISETWKTEYGFDMYDQDGEDSPVKNNLSTFSFLK